jgi:hypothetical protein
MAGRRASFLNPIRMYVFTSAIFFIILFSLQGPKNMLNVNVNAKKGLVELERASARQDSIRLGAKESDEREAAERRLAKLNLEIAAIKHLYGDSATRKFDEDEIGLAIMQHLNDSLRQSNITATVKERVRKKISERENDATISFWGLNPGKYHSVEEYDSAERKLPEDLRDGWFKRVMTHKLLHLDEEFRNDKEGLMEHVRENILHSFPKILFITLPLFALILNILYFRHKRYYYVDHGIFAIHVYCATFILLMTYILVQKLSDAVGVGWFRIICIVIELGIWFYILIYLYKAMRGFYHQGRAKTFLKYFITCLLAFIVNMILFVLFLSISVISLG